METIQSNTESAMSSSIILTENAARKVLEIRQEEEIEKDLALRASVIGGGCAGLSYDLSFEEKSTLDKEFSLHGVRIVVDQMSLMYLRGVEIDYVEAFPRSGFKFNNPNVKNTCGCGSSFGV